MSQTNAERDLIRLCAQAAAQSACLVKNRWLAWQTVSPGDGGSYNRSRDGSIGAGGVVDPDRRLGYPTVPRALVPSHVSVYIPGCYPAGVGAHRRELTPEQLSAAEDLMQQAGVHDAWLEWCARYPDKRIINRKYEDSHGFPVVFAWRERESAVAWAYPRQVRGPHRIFGLHEALECLGSVMIRGLTYQALAAPEAPDARFYRVAHTN